MRAATLVVGGLTNAIVGVCLLTSADTPAALIGYAAFFVHSVAAVLYGMTREDG